MANLISLEDYKKLRRITSTNAARDASFSEALPMIDDIIARFTGEDFLSTPTVATRRYPYEGQRVLDISACEQPTKVEIGSGTSLNELTYQTDYITGPTNEAVVLWLEFPYGGRFGPSPEMGFLRNLDKLTPRAWTFVDVTAKFGWPSVPQSVKLAAALLLDDFATAEDEAKPGVTSESIADLSFSYAQQNANQTPVLPPKVEQLLGAFRRVEL